MLLLKYCPILPRVYREAVINQLYQPLTSITRSFSLSRYQNAAATYQSSVISEKILQNLNVAEQRHSKLVKELSENMELSSEKMTEISKELSELGDVVLPFQEYKQAHNELKELEVMLNSEDPDLQEMAQEECESVLAIIKEKEGMVVSSLLPKDSADEGSAMLEIRAGTGGDEAALFANEVLKMYQRYAALQKWKVDVMSGGEDSNNRVKDVVVEIVGRGVFGKLRFESGVHRVQRVPATESQGRVHTSTITVAIMPQPTEVDVVIRESDLRIDLYRSSGAGGQHVNTTDSAVRITHIPTGIVVAMQDERSQHKNKARALKVLRARLYEQERMKLQTARRDSRNKQIGTGERSEKIRTYNFPQDRVTDHRINLTLFDMTNILNGENLNTIINSLRQHYNMEALMDFESKQD
ncbi:Peptide chain release factor 1, mitochondrial [Basidiobolus ranarum]|uniref:Peptide chain release factor 1, mitochondrial n=1 Tax=Basidiobolus ranarum TaxID=34480 RepID=A0ABR2W7L1_9FUNG